MATNSLTCVSSYTADTDYFPVKSTVTVSQQFTIQYFDSYKVIANLVNQETYVLYQCGTPQPNAGSGPKTKYFSVPASDVAVDNSLTGFFRALGVVPKAMGGASYVVDPCTQKAIANNDIASLTNFGNTTNVLLTQPSLTAIFDGYQNEQSSVRATIQAAGDTSPLARAEWIKVIGAFFNLEDKANEYFNGVMNQYKCISDTAKLHAVQPKVAWVEHSAAYPSWGIPESFKIDSAPYKKKLIQDAGAIDALAESGKAQVQYSTASDFLAALMNMNPDVVVDLTYLYNKAKDPMAEFMNIMQLNSLAPSQLDQLHFLKENRVWRTDNRMGPAGDDWYEGAVAMPDAVLADFAAAIYGNQPLPAGSPDWIRNAVSQKQVMQITASQCPADGKFVPAFVANPCTPPTGKPPGSLSNSQIAGIYIGAFIGFFSILAVLAFVGMKRKAYNVAAQKLQTTDSSKNAA